MNVTNGRTAVMTEVDYDRLKELLHAAHIRQTYGSMATSLETELAHREVVRPDEVPPGVVTMHSRVRVRDTRSGTQATYTLVYPAEANIDEGKVSVLAPLGRAILGAREGEIVQFNAPGGVRRLRIERVLYQPEAAGDYEL